MMVQRLVMMTEKKTEITVLPHLQWIFLQFRSDWGASVKDTKKKKNTFNYLVSADALWLWSITDLWTETFDPDTVSGTVTACVMTVCILY